MGELSPAILAGLAMVMRVDLARFSDLVTTAALLRPPGPTEDELKPLSAEDLNLRLHIDHPEAHCRAQGATSRLPAPSARMRPGAGFGSPLFVVRLWPQPFSGHGIFR